MTGPSFDIESHQLTATLYLHRPLAVADLRDVRIACALLPPEVRRLRIDARALAGADSRTLEILREVVLHWRRTRGGGVELCATERLLGMAPSSAGPTIQPSLVLVPENAALHAAFL